MTLRFNQNAFTINVEGKEYAMKITEKEFFEALEVVSNASKNAEGLSGSGKIQSVIDTVKEFADKTFGEGAFDEMTTGFIPTLSIAMQLFQYIVKNSNEYFNAVGKEFSVDRLKG